MLVFIAFAFEATKCNSWKLNNHIVILSFLLNSKNKPKKITQVIHFSIDLFEYLFVLLTHHISNLTLKPLNSNKYNKPSSINKHNAITLANKSEIRLNIISF